MAQDGRTHTAGRLAVYVEAADKRTFAGAIDWPGWVRSGRDERAALEALLAYAARYARAMRRAPFHPPRAPIPSDVEIVERIDGNATTNFGAPGSWPSHDTLPLDDGEAGRLKTLLRASWAAFDGAVREAGSTPLRTGPRGGGRQVPPMVAHVRDAEKAYLSKLGDGPAKTEDADERDEMRAVRKAFLDTFDRLARGEPAPRVPRSGRLWPPRYAVRRSAWHALDHAWEIEDRLVRS
jgi:hypothetical protein